MTIFYIVLEILIVLCIIAFSYAYAENTKLIYSKLPFISADTKKRRYEEFIRNKINIIVLDSLTKESSIKRLQVEIGMNDEKILVLKKELGESNSK